MGRKKQKKKSGVGFTLPIFIVLFWYSVWGIGGSEWLIYSTGFGMIFYVVAFVVSLPFLLMTYCFFKPSQNDKKPHDLKGAFILFGLWVLSGVCTFSVAFLIIPEVGNVLHSLTSEKSESTGWKLLEKQQDRIFCENGMLIGRSGYLDYRICDIDEKNYELFTLNDDLLLKGSESWVGFKLKEVHTVEPEESAI
jgi:hypothetical protein